MFQQIKQVFDPYNLLNPGKIIGDDPHLFIRNFRPVEEVADESMVPLQLTWTREEALVAANRCNGCGECRTHAPGLRMCPFFRNDVIEHATPRSKANLLRMVSLGTPEGKQITAAEIHELSQLCFNCKQCQLECPSNVDIPHMVMEAKAQYVATEGLNRSDWILSRAHSFGRLGCATAPWSNIALKTPWARWIIERILGIDRRRKLPPFARRPFLRSIRGKHLASAREITRERKPVVYFVDHYVNFHDPELGECLLKILEHNGIEVVVPEDQTGSGMAMASAGDLDAARAVAERNIRALAPFAREGCAIICTEPAAVVCLKEEYPAFINHPDLGRRVIPGDRVGRVPAGIAPSRKTADGLSAAGTDDRLPHAVSHSRFDRPQPVPRPAGSHSEAEGLGDRGRLLGHGGGIWAFAAQL